MSSNVINLKLIECGEDVRLDASPILEGAANEHFERMAVIGRTEDGDLYIAGTANAGETMILLEQARHFIAFGKDGVE